MDTTAPSLYEGYSLPHIKAGGRTSSIHPLQGVVDTLRGERGIGFLFDFKDRDKTYDHFARVSAPYGHVSLWILDPDRRPYGVSFRADTNDETCFDGIEDYWGPSKLFHPGIWKPQPGRVYSEKRLQDISWFRPLSKDGLEKAEARIECLKDRPPLYQVTSFHPKNLSEIHTLNCMSWAFHVVESTGEIEIPAGWKARPFPVIIANNVAFGAKFGIKGNQTSKQTIKAFQASAERLALPASEHVVPIRRGSYEKLHPREKGTKTAAALVPTS